MSMRRRGNELFSTRWFSFVIAAGVCLLVLLLQFTPLVSRLETMVLDAHFHWRYRFDAAGSVREGVTFRAQNPNVHPDILIIGVDNNALNRFGRWPFDRRIHGNFVNNLARIQNQDARERALFLDFFFSEPASNPTDDAMLVHSMRQSGRVFLENVLTFDPPRTQDYQTFFRRQHALQNTAGTITDVSGDWQNMLSFQGVEAPLIPYGNAVRGYGHANFIADNDEVFRRQPLVAKISEVVALYDIHELLQDQSVDLLQYQRLAWLDRFGEQHTIELPLTEQGGQQLLDSLEERGAPYTREDGSSSYRIRLFQDHFVPSITLSLALEYMNVGIHDIEVVLGSHILIREPQMYVPAEDSWQPFQVMDRPPRYNRDGELTREARYRQVDELRIPIDAHGQMLINYVGPRSSSSAQGIQTFPVRSYAGYASRITGPDPYTWPATMALENKIVMAGAFATGMADDEQATPFGMMYGVEMHANALNTILMDNFLHPVSFWHNLMVLLALTMLTAWVSSRLSTLWSMGIVLAGIVGLFLAVTTVFDSFNLIFAFSPPAIGIFLTFLSIVVYRVMTEERDKRRIRDMFGRYVSPQVVNQILENPPELGGVDRELTVLFSDIRGFTTLSESMTPQELVNHLNQYLTAMTDIILEFQGTLDKYVGDEIMCFWGAPLPQADHAIKACRCAVKQIQALEELNAQWPPEKRISIGIGINSGIMTVGNMGSLGRMNYTLMGDNVNLGARLEGTNKQYRTQIIISEYTYGLVKDHVIARELDNIRVKGKNKPVLIYELLDVPD
ncbi:adenylate/guanylate cyclase domain-containing protein [Spirochaeta africana]|uniref:Family 3 adenylate cyclase n=1 Tax=Spirochaeta africana (strain ATCC 700263 / DSM 8902 / Z-7692) TaxID=889378 RepID=H9UJ78_SPIAZ|nr:adenylate/guanylate cyclase domain-containing protein [Spirochaeta africana]AFG37571.1 family 3 adenylate cyclase [Spirochaeta africana DSM 8902]